MELTWGLKGDAKTKSVNIASSDELSTFFKSMAIGSKCQVETPGNKYKYFIVTRVSDDAWTKLRARWRQPGLPSESLKQLCLLFNNEKFPMTIIVT